MLILITFGVKPATIGWFCYKDASLTMVILTYPFPKQMDFIAGSFLLTFRVSVLLRFRMH